jgi:ABC-type oligopeptide transport system substrate-binding subunit
MPAPRALAERIRLDLAEVSVRARLVEVPTWSEYAARGSHGDYDMAVYGWQADTTDPNDFLSALLSSESIGSTNRSRYRDLSMDALLKRGRRETDPDARLAIYREVESLFQREMPFVPLFEASISTAYSRSVHGLAFSPTGLLRFDKTWKGN